MGKAEEELAAAMAAAMGVTISKEETPDNKEIIETTETNPDGTPKVKEELGDEGKKEGGKGEGEGIVDGKSTNPEKKLPTEAPVVDFDKLLLERSKGKFKSIDDIEKALSNNTAATFVNDEVAKINEYVKSGGTIDDFVKTQTTDFSKVSDLDVLREATRLADLTLSAEDITLLIEDQYGVLETATDKEKRLNDIKIKRDAVSARQQLIDNQKKWAVAKKSPEDLAAEGLAWKTSLHSTADKVEKLEIKLNDTDTFTYTVPVETKGIVKTENETLSNFFKRYINEDGSENVEKFVQDMIKLKNFDEIVKAAAGFNKSKGKEEVIKDIKNTNFNAKNKVNADGSVKSIAQQAAEQIFRQ